ncbi:SH3 domain-containing protein [Bacillus paramycoides]|uniref:SH3 domain-containing protein n=1 Tax=Bacillus paramycoides TaxID=2026194 RepID=UPI002E1FC005|nr:N-acetylmuramoyl-L-alanine amidase [Bacillus paramycoides]MED1104437.1 N-acetylmuramoyl-L-alanine amidase [Bacillus paramycoides]
MKKTMKHVASLLMILVLAVSFATSAFADRALIIPDLPKQPYRYGVGAYEGVVAHSTATSEAQFRTDVLKAYNGHSVTVEAKPKQPNEIPGVINEVGIVFIDGDNVNLRSGPSTTNSVIRKLQKGESYKVWGKLGNWLNLGGNQWFYYDSSYIRYNSGQYASVVGKRVESKVNSLNYYDRATWNKSYVAGTVDAGLGFTIIDKVDVNGSTQYKVKNSKGNVYYITASPAYVEVK